MLFFRSRCTLMKQLFQIQNVAPTFPPFPKSLSPKLASQQKCISAHRDKLMMDFPSSSFKVSFSPKALAYFFQQSITKPW